jgi:hypothetical protein
MVPIAISLVLLAFTAAPAAAHHSFAAGFDSHRPVTLKGVVTKIEWTNPHAHVFLDIIDDKHVTTNWKFELASPKVLIQQGWRARSMNVGDEVTIDGWMARDSTTTVNARIVTLADGHRVSAGSSGGDLPLKWEEPPHSDQRRLPHSSASNLGVVQRADTEILRSTCTDVARTQHRSEEAPRCIRHDQNRTL